LKKPDTSLSDLKTLLFILSESDHKKMYYEVSKKMLALYPNRIESYFDNALAALEIGEYQSALQLLDNAYHKSTASTTSFSKIIRDEIRNVINNYKSKLDYDNVDKSLTVNTMYDARLLFDWSSENAEFEIQFVNPQNKFFKWKHTNNDDFENFENEIKLGYTKNQFEIDGNAIGKWQINVKYIGNGSSDKNSSVYLKCSVQYNFGKPNQTEKIHLIKLYKEGQEEQFFTLKF